MSSKYSLLDLAGFRSMPLKSHEPKASSVIIFMVPALKDSQNGSCMVNGVKQYDAIYVLSLVNNQVTIFLLDLVVGLLDSGRKEMIKVGISRTRIVFHSSE
jgi:hypothetical protein